MTGLRIAHEVPVEDDAGHAPGPQENWQESFCVLWHVPQHRLGGHFHTGLQRNRGLADYWSHVVLDGKVVAHELAVKAPMPDSDYPSLELGPLQISTIEPLRSYRVVASYDDAQCEVRYEAFPGPVNRFDMDHPGVPIGRGHFESYGRVEGTITAGGRTVDFQGFGYHDHSWGPREYSNLLSMRNIVFNFGPDLYFQSFDCMTPQGRNVWGYIVADGELQQIASVTGRTEMADDGWSPLGLDLVLWTENGRAYHVTAVSECTTYAVTTAGTVRGVGYMRAEMGGRIGGGQVWVGEMRDAAPWQLESLRA